jgi:hypothetical protein
MLPRNNLAQQRRNYMSAQSESNVCIMICHHAGNSTDGDVRQGYTTICTVLVITTGHTVDNPNVKWIRGFDGPQFKTWRQDRIIELEIRASDG